MPHHYAVRNVRLLAPAIFTQYHSQLCEISNYQGGRRLWKLCPLGCDTVQSGTISTNKYPEDSPEETWVKYLPDHTIQARVACSNPVRGTMFSPQSPDEL
jgi:hypothetical protein